MSIKIAHQNIEAQQMVIGALLQYPDAILNIELSPTDFYNPKDRIVYSTILSMYQSREEIDLVTVNTRLKALDHAEAVGGIGYLSDCINTAPTAANIKVHAEIIKEAARMRQLKELLDRTGEQLHNGDPFSKHISYLESEIVELSELIKSKKDPHAAGIIADIKRNWKSIKDGSQKFIQTDYKIGESIPAFMPGHLWMLGGYTSVGKSTFLAQIIIDICEWDGRALVFSVEDSREEKMMKLIANLADVPQKYLLTGKLRDYQESRVEEAISKIEDVYKPIIYDDVRMVDEIRLKTKKHVLRDGIQVVCVDYVQNLRGSGSLYERMSDAAEKLFSMGRELGVTVIVLSQVNNDSAKEESPIIGLKGAGELAAAADIVLWLKRNKGYGKEHDLDVEIRKNRPFGVTGILPMQFSEKYTRIEART